MRKNNYQLQLDKWFETSAELINREKTLAIQRNDTEYAAKLSDELSIRTELLVKYQNNSPKDNHLGKNPVQPDEIVGTYSALGMNPGTLSGEIAGYFGKVNIKYQADSFGVDWLIESTQPYQTLQGTGILLNDLFSVVFQGPDGITGRTFTGLITYEILEKGVFMGTWTGLGIGILGKELLRKIV